ncbi:hypothetical protein EAE99_008508 [Botrytis elliptica]|nr:hypothetical protein EAE99_008508 [Botrytis elliptica]
MTLTSSLHKEWDGSWSEGGKEPVQKCKKPREVVFKRSLFAPAFGDSETSTKSSSPELMLMLILTRRTESMKRY